MLCARNALLLLLLLSLHVVVFIGWGEERRNNTIFFGFKSGFVMRTVCSFTRPGLRAASLSADVIQFSIIAAAHIRVDIKLLYHGIYTTIGIYINALSRFVWITYIYIYILHVYIILYGSSRPAAMGRRTYTHIYIIYYIHVHGTHIMYIKIIYERDDAFPPHRGLVREHVRHIFLFLFFKYRFLYWYLLFLLYGFLSTVHALVSRGYIIITLDIICYYYYCFYCRYYIIYKL